MNYRKLASLLISLSIISGNVLAKEMDLLDVYHQAQDRDPQIAAAEYQAKAGEEKANQGRAAFLPNISATGDAGVGHQSTEYDTSAFPNRSADTKSYNIAAQLTQPIYHASDWKNYAQSKLAVDEAAVQLEFAKQSLIIRVSKAYFDALSAQENVGVSEAQTRAFKESLERAKLTFKVGTATKTDMLDAQARYDKAVAEEIAAKNQLAVARQSLTSIIGTIPESLKKLSPNAKLLAVDPMNMKAWVDMAFANSPQLKLAQLGYDVSRLQVEKIKAGELPTLDLVASASKNKQYLAFIGGFMTVTNLAVQLQLNMPIYTGGLMSSQIREAESTRLQQKELQTNSERQVTLQTQQAYLNALNGRQQVDALKQAVISNDSALEATKKGVEVGVRTNLDLLNSQQQFFSTERDFTVAKYNYLLTVLQLKAAAGVLAEKDVKELNALLASK